MIVFVDIAKINVSSGKGGNGCVAFRREKHVPKGGPSGGDGGRGGDAIVKVDANLFTLQDLKYRKRYSAENGKNGSGSQKTGCDGNSVTIPVPLGTVVLDAITKKIIADLVEANQSVIIAYGGRGGRGNSHFATSTRQAPRYAESGKPGEEKLLIFELKILSDVGLVGLPNSGKSTLLSKLTTARPKIADYPFTTLTPNLGIVKYSEYRSFLMADIPGLIEGAHEGKGLGLRFLRHLERTKILVFLIESIDPKPGETYKILNDELNKYFSGFSKCLRIIAFSKSDLVGNSVNLEIDSIENMPISAVTGAGLDIFVRKVVKLLDADG